MIFDDYWWVLKYMNLQTFGNVHVNIKGYVFGDGHVLIHVFVKGVFVICKYPLWIFWRVSGGGSTFLLGHQGQE